MGIGAILVGVALLAVVVAYLARPFRVVNSDQDRGVEAWVSQVRVEAKEQGSRSAEGPSSSGEQEPINYCPQCGRRIDPDDHFCAGCGRRLQ